MNIFFTPSYWLNMRPGSLHFSGMIIFLVLILAFVTILFLYSLAKKRKNNIYFRVWRSMNSFALTNLILALFLLFFEYEELFIFSSRLWLLIWGVSMLVWLAFILKSFQKIPDIRKEHEKIKEFKKYIP